MSEGESDANTIAEVNTMSKSTVGGWSHDRIADHYKAKLRELRDEARQCSCDARDQPTKDTWTGVEVIMDAALKAICGYMSAKSTHASDDFLKYWFKDRRK